MNIPRARADAKAQVEFAELYRLHGGIPENHQLAIDLRMQFFRKYILNRRTNDFKTPVEKDWAYVAWREYFYDVNVRGAADAFALGISTQCIRMFMLKKFVMWPFFPVAGLTFWYRQRELFVLHNKKLFDMCNVGEQYELGFARNVVLRNCNTLLDREDF